MMDPSSCFRYATMSSPERVVWVLLLGLCCMPWPGHLGLHRPQTLQSYFHRPWGARQVQQHSTAVASRASSPNVQPSAAAAAAAAAAPVVQAPRSLPAAAGASGAAAAAAAASAAQQQQQQQGHRQNAADRSSNGSLGALVARNQLHEAVSLLELWLDQQKQVHGLAAGDLLEALCRQGQHEVAWPLLRRLAAAGSKRSRLPLKVLHRLLKTAGEHGTVSDVLSVFHYQQRCYGFASLAVQTTLIHALLKADARGKPGNTAAYEAWSRLKASGMQLDAQALLAGLHACACMGRIAEAEALLEPISSAAGFISRPAVSAHNLLMKAHLAAGNPEAARRVFSTMKSRGLTPDTVTFNTLLHSFAAAGELPRARGVLDKMRREGCTPDVWSFTILAMGYGRLGLLMEMQQVFGEMQQAGVTPNLATYVALLDSFASAGDMSSAALLMQHIQQQQQGIQQQQNQQQSIQQQQQQQQQQRQFFRQQQEQGQPQSQPPPAAAAAAAMTAHASAASAAAGTFSVRNWRLLFNTLIKGHLRAAAAAAAADSTAAVGSEAAARLPSADQQQQQQLVSSGYDAALIVLQEMAAAGVPPAADTYTMFINHVLQVGDREGLALLLESLVAAAVQPDQVLLTSLIKAAGQAADPAAAVEVFDALIQTLDLPFADDAASGNSSSGSSGSSGSSSSGGGDNGVDGAAADVLLQAAAGAQQQQQQQQQFDKQQAPGSNKNSNSGNSSNSSTSSSSNRLGMPKQPNLTPQQRLQRLQQQRIVRPLPSSSGPDTVAWNALVAALVQSGRLTDAAAALERAVQAAAASGRPQPPVEAFAAVIRGHRNAGNKSKAVAALRRFLSLGGQPARVMCNDVITLCLRDSDLRTARQVVRAMQLTGCVSDEEADGYAAWFDRWDMRQRAAAAAAASPGRGGSSSSSISAAASFDGGGSSSYGATAVPSASAVERLKWWLGLPNSYYNGGGSAAAAAAAAAAATAVENGSSAGSLDSSSSSESSSVGSNGGSSYYRYDDSQSLSGTAAVSNKQQQQHQEEQQPQHQQPPYTQQKQEQQQQQPPLQSFPPPQQ